MIFTMIRGLIVSGHFYSASSRELIRDSRYTSLKNVKCQRTENVQSSI